MIARYQRKEFAKLWSDEYKFKTYLSVELASIKAWMKQGVIPKEDVLEIVNHAKFTMDDISKFEEETKHDVIAFTKAVSKHLGKQAKWFHYGLTSTDVVDTANGLLIKEANTYLLQDLNDLVKVLKEKALQYKNTPIMGRTHGMHAEVTSFGLKFALWYDEFQRHLKRFNLARKEIEVGKISGAVGNHAHVSPVIQDEVCKELGLQSANISTQTLQRDRHAFYLNVLSLIGTSLEKISLEIRHLSRSEIGEVQEPFTATQKGSSAMPQKKNPILSENITGLSRVLRGYALTSYENIPLWHERDISHSSAERIIIPDATTVLDFMLNRMTNLLKNLIVNESQMHANIYLTYETPFAQRVLNRLIEKGLQRDVSYDIIQSLSFQAIHLKTNLSELIKQNSFMTNHLSDKEIDELFDIKFYLEEMDTIYKRVGLI
jgi:adenylosuccinate lyase